VHYHDHGGIVLPRKQLKRLIASAISFYRFYAFNQRITHKSELTKHTYHEKNIHNSFREI
jgi:hypothetical protein